jgi:alpha-methylacyl-CoA racemase
VVPFSIGLSTVGGRETGAMSGQGPLAGIRVIEMHAIGPVPLAGTLLSDMGAEVIKVERPTSAGGSAAAAARSDVLRRGRRSVVIDLRAPESLGDLLRLVDSADVLLEGHRPGVMERLGAGPDVCLERNPRLVYGRMTGWGQDGPLRDRAGHDIDYLAVAGALHPMGSADRPPAPPLNLIGDYGGGTMLLAFGVVAALYERERSGRGQVVDAAMVDGIAFLSSIFHSMLAAGSWSEDRESNLLDGGAHFYRAYETADGRFLAVGAIEPQFYAELLDRLGLDAAAWPQHDRARWPELRERLAGLIRAHTLEEWTRRFEGSDACVARANTLAEAGRDPHLAARRTFVEAFGVNQPAPAPRFSRTPGAIAGPPPEVGADGGLLGAPRK